MNILITMIGGMPGGDSESLIKFIKNAGKQIQDDYIYVYINESKYQTKFVK